jgi:class 3 adenylate cyclase/cytochrome c-type biogenesis protein CcmH/NrfG
MSQILERSPLEAGREAVARHAWREGYDLLREAEKTEALGPEDLEGLAESAWWTGRLDDCIAAREQAHALYLAAGEPRPAARIAIMVANDYFAKRAHATGAGWFNRAQRLLEPEGDCAEQGWLLFMQGMSAAQMGDHDAAIAAAQRMLDIGSRHGDLDLQAFGLMGEGSARVAKGDVDAGLALLDEATVAAVSGGIGPYASGIIYCVAIGATAKLADYQRAGEWTEASRRWCERQSISGFPGVCRVHRAEIMRLRGSWAEAESEARRATTELANFNLEYAGEGFYEIGEIRLRMGDLDEARDAFRQAHELGRDPQPGLAMLQLAEGNAEPAVTSIKRSLADPSLDRLRRCRLLSALVAMAIAAGDLDTATEAADEAKTIADDYGSTVLKACALMGAGELKLAHDDPIGAVNELRESWRLWRTVDLPYETARTRLVLGAALRAAGDEEGALLEIQAARGVFEKLGAVLDLRRAMEMLGEAADDHLPKASLPGVTVTKTFMFTDIVGSTNLVEALGDAAWENVLAWHDATMRELFAANCGQEVKQVGDGFFVAFDHPGEAVECAIGIQKKLVQHRSESGFAPQVRIGLHSTDATRKGGDYAGMGVHTAARIGALANGGEVLASRAVVDAAGPRFPVSGFRAVELKGVGEPVEVASIEAG